MAEDTRAQGRGPFEPDDSIQGAGFGSKPRNPPHSPPEHQRVGANSDVEVPAASGVSLRRSPPASHERTVLTWLLVVVLAGSTVGVLQLGLDVVFLGPDGRFAYLIVCALAFLAAIFGLTQISDDRRTLLGALLLGVILHTVLYTLGRPFRTRGIRLAVDAISVCLLLPLFALAWRSRGSGSVLPRGARRGQITYEGRVHGGGREFTLMPAGDKAAFVEPVEVHVDADWAQRSIHDGDKLQVDGKWKKQFWKRRWWVEAKRVYNFTTGANWDADSGTAVTGD